jgi:hypothetical protein
MATAQLLTPRGREVAPALPFARGYFEGMVPVVPPPAGALRLLGPAGKLLTRPRGFCVYGWMLVPGTPLDRFVRFPAPLTLRRRPL